MHAWVLSHVQLFAIQWTTASQAPLSIEFSKQEYWSGLPFPSPGDLPDPGIERLSVVSPVLAGGFFTSWVNREPHFVVNLYSWGAREPSLFGLSDGSVKEQEGNWGRDLRAGERGRRKHRFLINESTTKSTLPMFINWPKEMSLFFSPRYLSFSSLHCISKWKVHG